MKPQPKLKPASVRRQISKIYAEMNPKRVALVSKVVALDKLRNVLIGHVQDRCEHEWGPWSSGHEMPSYRVCEHCGKENGR